MRTINNLKDVIFANFGNSLKPVASLLIPMMTRSLQTTTVTVTIITKTILRTEQYYMLP